MKFHPDENDRLRAGTLPLDPLEGTVPFEPRNGVAGHDKVEAAPLPWRTLAQVKADAEANPRDWKWHGFLATRTVAVVSGEPKGGKSEILAAFLATYTRGGEWFGVALAPGGVVIASEQGDHDLQEQCYRYGVDEDRVVVLSRDKVGTPPAWADMVAAAVAKAVEIGATLLLIDTFSFWAAIEGEGERVEGTVREALLVLQLARNSGLATVLVHHTVKSKEVEGIAALRGSGAFAASVESVGVYRRCSKEADDSRRKLEVFSRIGGCSTMTVERVIPADGSTPHFRSLEPVASKPAGSTGSDLKIVAAVTQAGGWVPTKSFPELTGLSKRLLESRLPDLVRAERLDRVGGTKGHPCLYALPGTPRPGADRAATEGDPGEQPASEQPDPTPPANGKKGAKRRSSVSSASSANLPQCGGGAVPPKDSPHSPHPPTGERSAAVNQHGTNADLGASGRACGESDPGALFDNKPTARDARRQRDEGGRA